MSSIDPEKDYQTPDFSKFAYLEYKKYPDHLSHFNRKSSDYIESYRDDYQAGVTTSAHNYYVNRVKEDLAM